MRQFPCTIGGKTVFLKRTRAAEMRIDRVVDKLNDARHPRNAAAYMVWCLQDVVDETNTPNQFAMAIEDEELEAISLACTEAMEDGQAPPVAKKKAPGKSSASAQKKKRRSTK